MRSIVPSNSYDKGSDNVSIKYENTGTLENNDGIMKNMEMAKLKTTKSIESLMPICLKKCLNIRVMYSQHRLKKFVMPK